MSLSPRVTDDEIYFFRKQILPQKEPSPNLVKKAERDNDDDDEEEEEMDGVDFIPGLSGVFLCVIVCVVCYARPRECTRVCMCVGCVCVCVGCVSVCVLVV